MSDDLVPFKAVIDRETLADYIDTYQAVVDETVLEFTEDGIYSSPVDPATVGMVEQYLRPGAFEHYDATGIRTGVNLTRIDDFLSKTDDELVHVEFDAETRKLEWECGAADYTMACIDPDTVRDGQEPSDLDLPNEVHIDADALAHAIGLVDMVSDHVDFEGRPENDDAPLRIYGEGDTDDMSVTPTDSLAEGTKITGAVESKFSLDYMESLVGVIPSGSEVRVEFGEEFPIRMDYEYAEGHAEVRMMCAPRISSS